MLCVQRFPIGIVCGCARLFAVVRDAKFVYLLCCRFRLLLAASFSAVEIETRHNFFRDDDVVGEMAAFRASSQPLALRAAVRFVTATKPASSLPKTPRCSTGLSQARDTPFALHVVRTCAYSVSRANGRIASARRQWSMGKERGAFFF